MGRGGYRPGSGRRKKQAPEAVEVKAFVVNGANRNFADVILEYATRGDSCIVASYGFGTEQVDRLVFFFKSLVLVADESHSKLNSKAFDYVMGLSGKNGFAFIPTKTHAKMAIINNETVIFTSANLSANKRLEMYVVAPLSAITGMDAILEVFKNPQKLIDEDRFSQAAAVEKTSTEAVAPLDFLLAQMNNETLPLDFRVRVATAAAPYVHSRKGEGAGKKSEREEKAKTAGAGRFAASPPPLIRVK